MGNGDGRKKEQIKSYYMLRTLHMTIEIAMFYSSLPHTRHSFFR